MALDVEIKQPKFYQQIIGALSKGFLSHSYLIESTNISKDHITEYVRFFVKSIYEFSYNKDISIAKEKIFHLVDKLEYPDYVEIRPINNVIKKDQLLKIREDFSNKSLYNTKKVYVVYEADKMNASSANTILKFLEEPSEDVVAIFVTNNQYNVLDTIRSRCQILSLQYEKNSHNYSDELRSFFDDIDNRHDNNLLLKFNIYNSVLFKDKTNAISTLREIIDYYKDKLDDNPNNLIENMAIVSIFEEELKKLKYNVNIKLWLDNLLLLLMEV